MSCISSYLVKVSLHGCVWTLSQHYYQRNNLKPVSLTLNCFVFSHLKGCLQVVPGTHKQPILSHFKDGKFVSSITDPSFDSSKAVDVEVPAGGASFHHVRTAHASCRNNSTRSRRVCFTQYCAVDSWPLIGVVGPEGYGVEGPVDWERFCSTIVRGSPTLYPRMVNVPISLPFPYERSYDVFDSDGQEAKEKGRESTD